MNPNEQLDQLGRKVQKFLRVLFLAQVAICVFSAVTLVIWSNYVQATIVAVVGAFLYLLAHMVGKADTSQTSTVESVDPVQEMQQLPRGSNNHIGHLVINPDGSPVEFAG